MEDSPTEHFEHAEHAEHVAHLDDSFLTKVSITIAILAVVAAAVGSLETIETAASIGDKNDAVFLQNKATDNWSFFQAKSIKKTTYEIAAASNPALAEQFNAQAKRYESDGKELLAKGEDLEHQTDAKLESSEHHEHRHHILTIGVTLLHISIAIATISIIMRGKKWPWYCSLALGGLGAVIGAFAYL
jgi:hypothetical protein